MFSNLRAVNVTGLTGANTWESLPDVHNLAIRNVLRTRHVISASVVSIVGFPLSILTTYSQLKHITIHGIDVTEAVSSGQPLLNPASVAHKGQLESLTGGEDADSLLNQSGFFTWSIPPTEFHSTCAFRRRGNCVLESVMFVVWVARKPFFKCGLFTSVRGLVGCPSH